MISDKSLLLQ